MATPSRGAHPRELVAAAVDRYGEAEVVRWCCRLMRGVDRDDDPDVAWLGGSEDWLPYWRRTWGARGLLYVWNGQSENVEALRAALGDENWRVREMACKVVRARTLDGLIEVVEPLTADPNARVRSAATRALVVLRG